MIANANATSPRSNGRWNASVIANASASSPRSNGRRDAFVNGNAAALPFLLLIDLQS